MNALLISTQDNAKAIYRTYDLFFIEYPNGGKLKSMLENVNDQMTFTADKNTPGVQDLINKLNQKLVQDRKSPAQVEDMKINFKTTLTGGSDKATLEHIVELDATLVHFVIKPVTQTEDGVIDLNWRGFMINEPVIVKTQQYGDVEINFPTGYLYVKQPDIMKLLENTDAAKILGTPSLDFKPFTDLTIDKWHYSFDATGGVQDAARFGFKEMGGAKAVTYLALGESSVREGIQVETEKSANFAIDSDQYRIRHEIAPNAASLEILEYATPTIQGTDEGASISMNAPPEGKSQSGGFPITVLAVLGGMLGAVAGFVLWRANKK